MHTPSWRRRTRLAVLPLMLLLFLAHPVSRVLAAGDATRMGDVQPSDDDEEDLDDDDDTKGLKLSVSGFLSSDTRYSIPKFNPFWCSRGSSGYCHGGRSINDIRSGFSRNENIARMRFSVRSGDYKGIAEIDFVWTGFSRGLQSIEDLSLREKIDPFRLEAHAIYFDIVDFAGVKGLDVRMGKQIVMWGKADMFNPTSNLNALDLEDTLLFGDRVSNNMVKVDYNFWKDFILTLVWVPIFKPNQLPASAALAVKGVDRIPIVEDDIRRRLHVERDGAVFLAGPTVVTQAIPELPETRIENSQIGFKFAGKVAKMDFSLSYYYGRSGIPQPYVERTFGINDIVDARTALLYPRMHVLGFDWAGQIPLGKKSHGSGIGFWFEMAVFFPQKVVMPIFQNSMPVIPDGEYDYDGDGQPGGTPPTIVDSRPFAKWTLGFDYTFNKYVFMNVQWVHGFPDEFGAGDFFHRGFIPTRGFADLDTNNDGQDDLDVLFDCGVVTGVGNGQLCAKEYLRPRLGDYLVAGVDLKFLSEKLFLRLFFILDLTGVYIEEWVQTPGQNDPTVGHRRRTWAHPFTGNGFNMIFFPQLTYSFGYGMDVSAGALLTFGKSSTKFGDTATGGTVVFGKAKFSF